MYDYKLLEALALVVRENGFEKAANKLFITQSAVSQRIKALEELSGQILITRISPPKPTSMGKKLIKHYYQVKRLEDELQQSDKSTSLSIGLNADSLATWFLPVIESFLKNENTLIELKVDDQDRTGELLKNGEVAGCISSGDSVIQGCSKHYLGQMEYVLVSTPDFFSHWFQKGITIDSLEKAPAVIFNRKDLLHERYLNKHFEHVPDDYPIHYLPSSEKFLTMLLMGHAYGVVPMIQCRDYLENNRLIKIKKETITVPLFWNHWKIDTRQINTLTKILIENSREFLIIS